MSWARLLALCSLLALAACGLEPMYGRNAGNKVAAALSGVAIQPISDRVGQELRNYLIERIGGSGRRDTAYLLDVSMAENRSDLGVLRDSSSTYARLTLNAAFVLRDAKTGQPVFSDRATAINSYSLNLLEGGYSTLAAEANARDRAVRLLGDEIITRLSIRLHRTATAQP